MRYETRGRHLIAIGVYGGPLIDRCMRAPHVTGDMGDGRRAWLMYNEMVMARGDVVCWSGAQVRGVPGVGTLPAAGGTPVDTHFLQKRRVGAGTAVIFHPNGA